jgi:hypothetical protein
MLIGIDDRMSNQSRSPRSCTLRARSASTLERPIRKIPSAAFTGTAASAMPLFSRFQQNARNVLDAATSKVSSAVWLAGSEGRYYVRSAASPSAREPGAHGIGRILHQEQRTRRGSNLLRHHRRCEQDEQKDRAKQHWSWSEPAQAIDNHVHRMLPEWQRPALTAGGVNPANARRLMAALPSHRVGEDTNGRAQARRSFRRRRSRGLRDQDALLLRPIARAQSPHTRAGRVRMKLSDEARVAEHKRAPSLLALAIIRSLPCVHLAGACRVAARPVRGERERSLCR